MTITNFINSITTKVYSRIRSSMGDAECRRALKEHLQKQCIIHGVINWVAYDWNNPSTRPPQAGRYLIYRSKCNKLHFEQWNGSGWSSSNNDCTHWTKIEPPCL